MSYGLEILTQNGLVDTSNIFSFRFLKKESFTLPSGSQSEKFVTTSIPSQTDLGSGPVLIVPYHTRVPNQPTGSIYDLEVRVHEDDFYRSNAQNLPSSIRLLIMSRTAPGEVDPQALVNLYTVQL